MKFPKISSFLVCAIVYVYPNLTYSGILQEAIFGAKIQINYEKDSVKSCGVVIFGSETKVDDKNYAFNGSMISLRDGIGIVKARISEIDKGRFGSQNFTNNDLKPLVTQNIFIKGKNKNITSPLGDIKKSEDPGYVLYSSAMTIPILLDIINDEIMQIGFQQRNAKTGVILFGKIMTQPDEKTMLLNCLQEILKK